ncbi:phosducin [Histoplasma capsulatum var. duboisii H88]|uniref:Phosducin n=1 Tax=Ajellomyces capsulatus (strain H88) TaxID=544711 RepID=F0UDV5_AJEC8|nr:phosducin [Histoplasma capsulatum var. duboisii H88]
MSAAQDEVDRLLNPKEKVSCHPEDRLTSDNDSNLSFSEEESLTYVHSDTETIPPPHDFKAALHILLRLRSGHWAKASCGCQSSKGRRNAHSDTQQANEASPPPDETEDERFMRQWREARMLELQRKSKRRVSPSKRRYGTVEVVNANGYLDAIEKVTPDTVVVVCIYDPESPESNIVEDCLATVARKQATTRFVKLHYEIAEMEHVTPPALLAYRNGDVFATIMDIFHQLPSGRDCSSASLEDLLMQHRVF